MTQLAAVLSGREKVTVEAVFERIPARLVATIEAGSCARYDGFIDSNKKVFDPQIQSVSKLI